MGYLTVVGSCKWWLKARVIKFIHCDAWIWEFKPSWWSFVPLKKSRIIACMRCGYWSICLGIPITWSISLSSVMLNWGSFIWSDSWQSNVLLGGWKGSSRWSRWSDQGLIREIADTWLGDFLMSLVVSVSEEILTITTDVVGVRWVSIRIQVLDLRWFDIRDLE